MSASRPLRVAVCGTGISGLSAAYRLVKACGDAGRPLELHVLEAADRPGGSIRTDRQDGFVLEWGPDCFISTKPAGIKLCEELGIDGKLIGTNPNFRKSYIARDSMLHPVPEGFHMLAPSRFWPFVTSRLFSWPGKIRMGMDLFLPRGSSDADETLEQFVVRRLGKEALDYAAQPMIGGIYTADPAQLSLKATMPQFLALEQKHRSLLLGMWRGRQAAGGSTGKASGARYDLFVSFPDGLQTLVDELVGRLPEECIRTGSAVSGLSRNGSGWRLEVANGPALELDGVCLTLPSGTAASLVASEAPDLAGELRGIPTAATATVNLGFDRAHVSHALDGMGFVVPAKENRSLLACTFSSVKFAGRAPEGKVLVRAFAGGAMDPETAGLDDDELIRRLLEDLKVYLGLRADPGLVSVARHTASMPQYVVGHLDRIERISRLEQKLPGLVLAGNAFRGIGIPDCAASSAAAVTRLLAELPQ